MAKKLIDLEEAAQMLNVSVDVLNQMRQSQEISAYRDGGSWKFKIEEIERFMRDRDDIDEPADDISPLGVDEDLELAEPPEMPMPGGSTVVGGSNAPKANAGQSDLHLGDEDLDILPLDSGLHSGATSSNLALGEETANRPGGSSKLQLSPEGSKLGGSGLSANFEELDALDLDLPTAQESGIGLGGSSSKIPMPGSSNKMPKSGADSKVGKSGPKISSVDLSLSDDDLLLGEAPTKPGESGPKPGSGIDVTDDEDDELVLGGSDISHSLADSGVKLIDLEDSGISLEQPLDVGGSAIESLELGEDDMLELEDNGDDAEPIKADEDFLLTPMEEAVVDESDSGSQVIALDSDVEFDEEVAATAGVAAPRAAAPAGLMADEDFGGGLSDDMGGGFGAATLGSSGAMAAPMGVGVYRTAEPGYSASAIAMLAVCVVILTLCGSFTYDLVRNMWSWDGPSRANSSIMDSIVAVFDKR